MDTSPRHLLHKTFNAVSTRRQALGRGMLVGAVLSLRGPGRATAQEVTPLPIEQTPDVVYGEIDGTPLLLDIRHPPQREDHRPAVDLLHGGGLVFGSRTDNIGPATELVKAGYVTFSIDYRLFNQGEGTNPWPAQLDDAQRAVRWVRANAETYGVDPERIAAYGHSSGGQLAALLGVRETRDDADPALAGISSRVNCVVDLSGDTDLTIPYPKAMWAEINVGLLGGTEEEVPEVYRDASPLYQVDEQSVPFLVIHGARDFDTPVEHARRLVEALHEAEVEVVYLELPDGDHFATTWWLMMGPWILTFLSVQLHPER